MKPSESLRRLRVVLLFALGVLAVAARGAEPPRVLLLFSNDRLLPANQRFDEGIRRALDPRSEQTSVTFFAEFLDAVRLGGESREQAMEDYLQTRYHETPPDVLVALGPQALTFLLARRETLFPGKPIVFGGISQERLARLQIVPGVTGLPMELSIAPAIEALLSMRPDTREILLVHGASDFDRGWRDNALRQGAPFADRVRFMDTPHLPLNELKTYLAGLPATTGVILLTYFQSPTGETYTPARVARELAAISSVPILGPYDTYIGTGVLGVGASPFEEEGLVVGGLIRRVLAGEKPESIGILPPAAPRVILDHRQMKRWEIESVPAGAELRFQVPTLWEDHRTAIIVTLVIVVGQGVSITWLVLARRRQMRVKKALRLSEARFSGVFRGSPVAISIIRQADGRIVDVNPAWEAITGVSRALAVGRTPLETGLLIEGDAEARFRAFLVSGKSLHDYEQTFRAPDGSTRWLSLSTERITLHDETCHILVAKDVTELHEGEEARRQLAHASRLALLGEMTASIAHEVNQPLGAILSNTDAAEMLMEQAPPPLDEVRRILADIRRDDLRASAVIQRVRALVGHRELHRAPLALNEAILDALRLVTHDAHRRGVSLVHELADGLPVIHADAGQIEQVLINLLMNAMDAMKDTPVADRLLVVRSSRPDTDSVRASVEDRGHGIPPEKLGRVFDSFFTTKESGMGLGLALSRSIAEAHGGRLLAGNNAHAGATFHLVLPVNLPASHDDNRR